MATFLYLIFAFLMDIYRTVTTNFTKDDFFIILETVAFGLVINSLYGIMTNLNIKDFYILLVSLYTILKIKRKEDNE